MAAGWLIHASPLANLFCIWRPLPNFRFTALSHDLFFLQLKQNQTKQQFKKKIHHLKKNILWIFLFFFFEFLKFSFLLLSRSVSFLLLNSVWNFDFCLGFFFLSSPSCLMCVKGIVLITSFIHRMAQGRESKHSEESGRIVEIETLPIRWAESAGWDSFRCSIRLEQSAKDRLRMAKSRANHSTTQRHVTIPRLHWQFVENHHMK